MKTVILSSACHQDISFHDRVAAVFRNESELICANVKLSDASKSGKDSCGLSVVEALELVRKSGAKRVVLELDGREKNLTESIDWLTQQLYNQRQAEVVLMDCGECDSVLTASVVVQAETIHSIAALAFCSEIAAETDEILATVIVPDDEADEETIMRITHDLATTVARVHKASGRDLKRNVITAKHRNLGLREATATADLLIVSGDNIEELRQLRCGNAAAGMLPVRQQLPIMMVWSPRQMKSKLRQSIGRLRGLFPILDREERLELVDRLQVGSKWNVDFIAMMALSTTIASLGLLQDSTAVVIGAMLVAPLMTPLIAAGLALVQGNLVLFRDAIQTMAFGVCTGGSISLLIGLLAPRDVLSQEIIARGNPDIIDLAVALASGMAAAYALSRKNVSSALPGVAIAAALVPPLSCISIAISFGQMSVALGAAVLLVANLSSIILGAALTFRILRVRGPNAKRMSGTWAHCAILLVALVPAVLLLPLWAQTHKIRNTAKVVSTATSLNTY